MDAFSALYYLGIASCGMQGAARTMKMPRKQGSVALNFFKATAIIVASGFGGGFTRDLSLHQFPVVFTSECQPDIIISLIGALLFFSAQENVFSKTIIQRICLLTDAVGLGTFIAIGIDRGILLGLPTFVAVWSGCATALCGGILSALLCGVSLKTVLSSSICYRVLTCLGSVLYTLFRRSGPVDIVYGQFGLVAYTTLFVLLIDNTSWEAVKKMRQRAACISARQDMILDMKALVLAFAIASHTLIEYIWTSYNLQKRMQRTLFCHKIPVWLHCIRQM